MCFLLLAVEVYFFSLLLPSYHLVDKSNPTQFSSPNSLLHATLCFWQMGHFVDHCGFYGFFNFVDYPR